MKTRTAAAEAEIIDAKTVLAWAKEHHPEIVKTETREWVNVSDVRPLVSVVVEVDPDADELITVTKVVDTDTGIAVPGLGVRAEHVTVTVLPEQP